MPSTRSTYARGTWIDPEEFAYNCSLSTTRRKAKAICEDGRPRTFHVGIPDTFFSIPARGKIGQQSVTGYICINTDDEDGTYVEFRCNKPSKYER
jgi:hypothetical protein